MTSSIHIGNGLPTPDPSASPRSLMSPLSMSSSSLARDRGYAFATQCVTVDPPPGHSDPYNSSSVPIYQSATFKGMDGDYDYTRSGNPTRSYLEHHLAKISGAQHAFAVTSGMAALDVITRLLKPGDEVIAGDDLYGGTNRLLVYLRDFAGVVVHHVDSTNPSTLVPHLNDKTAMVLLESPTNPLLKIAPIRELVSLIRGKSPKAVIVVDNTMMSPYLQRPLELGADVVYDSGTKYLSGHHDLMAGVVVCDRDDVAKQLAHTINAAGSGLSPFESFLLLRGTKTLAIRLSRQQSTAHTVASYLSALGFQVFYPSLPNHPGQDTHFSQASGGGAVLSFLTGSTELSEKIVRETKLWGISVSFGAVNSLISMPCLMSHASIAPSVRKERGLPEDLIRLCVGIEDPMDLLNDLEGALTRAGAIEEGVVDGEKGAKRVLVAPEGEVVTGWVKEKAGKRTVGKDGDATPITGTEIEESKIRQPGGRSLLISAPGKVILFGEHAVVYGVTALAASVGLRCYALVHTSPSTPSSEIVLSFPELGFGHSWPISSLPWTSLPSSVSTTEIDESFLQTIDTFLGEQGVEGRGKDSAKAFLYLYMIVLSSTRPAIQFTIRCSLPISAGLGSSAAFSTAIAGSFLTLAHQPSRAQPVPHADLVNTYAFLGEKILHGTPSGVDNACAVYGGGVVFRRAVEGKQGGMDRVSSFREMKLLITDSAVGRNTKVLVDGVRAFRSREPEKVNGILDEIQSVSDRAKEALTSREENMSTKEVESVVGDLVSANHELLRQLGVSHPVLEKIVDITASQDRCLKTKLTGAGGGGCAVTLLRSDLEDSQLVELQSELQGNGFKPYLTTVGGPGFGIHSLEGGDEKWRLEEQASFEARPREELDGWANAKEWTYVASSSP